MGNPLEANALPERNLSRVDALSLTPTPLPLAGEGLAPFSPPPQAGEGPGVRGATPSRAQAGARESSVRKSPGQAPIQRGFTLIELLVVLVIVGIMLGLASVRLAPDDEHTLATEMRRLAVLLEQARDEAVTRGEPIAFSVERAHYRFWRRGEADAWVPCGGDDLLRDREATAGVRLMDWRAGQVDAADAARVLFLPSGASTPFSADFALNAAHARLRGDSLGRMRVETSFGAAS